MRLIKFYRDGLRIWRWGWRIRWRLIHGFGIGIEKVNSPFTLMFQLRLGIVIVCLEQALVWQRTPDD